MEELQARQVAVQEQQIAAGFSPRLLAIDQSRSQLHEQVRAQAAEVDRLLVQLDPRGERGWRHRNRWRGPVYRTLLARLRSEEAELERLRA
jgi:hypothetical protein